MTVSLREMARKMSVSKAAMPSKPKTPNGLTFTTHMNLLDTVFVITRTRGWINAPMVKSHDTANAIMILGESINTQRTRRRKSNELHGNANDAKITESLATTLQLYGSTAMTSVIASIRSDGLPTSEHHGCHHIRTCRQAGHEV